MKTIHFCPGCGGTPSRRWPAITAPFIAAYALLAPVSLCSLLECGSCGLRFFDGRFEPEEMARLYADYRGESYFRIRHKHEFWYLRRHNEGTGRDSNILAARKSATELFLRRHVRVDFMTRVLDYGGDSGQFIPDGIGVEKEVFEVSNAEPVPGVRRVADEQELKAGSYDLVLLNHVLEHAPNPVELLRRVAALLKDGTGILHVEVPLEYYNLERMGQGPKQGKYLTWLTTHPAWLRYMDFYSTLFRVSLNTIPPFGFLKLHEHINLFNEQAFRRACQVAGLEVLAQESEKRGAGIVVAILARHPAGK